jgi:hypothetical protein
MIDNYFEPLKYRSYTDDGWGRTASAWANGDGFIQPIGGNESFQHFNFASRVTARLYAPLTLAITHGMDVEQDGVVYSVLYASQAGGVSNTGSHKEILLGAVE